MLVSQAQQTINEVMINALIKILHLSIDDNVSAEQSIIWRKT